MMSSDKKETQLGGIFLLLGSITILVTIFFEFRIGWIGVERTESELLNFTFENWSGLKQIWGWQMLGHSCFIVSYFLIIKHATTIMRTAWSVLLVCGLMVVIAFGLTLGSYYPALEVYSTQPAIFDTLRGGIGTLYRIGSSGILVFALVFLMETFSKNGKVKRVAGLATISIVAISIIIGLVTSLSLKVTGATWFLMPLVLGYSYWRNADPQIRAS